MADRRLQVFHTVARLLSFTKAAESLHMTQPAVTFQIRQLEEYFNTRLFDRTHNRISLTDAGEKVYAYSERILGLYREMDNEIRTLTGEIIGVLVIGASTTVAEYLLPKLLGEFQALYPKVKLRLKVSNSMGVVHMVENNDIDVGLSGNGSDCISNAAINQHLLEGSAPADNQNDCRRRRKTFAREAGDILFLEASGEAKREEREYNRDQQGDNLMANELTEYGPAANPFRIDNIGNRPD